MAILTKSKLLEMNNDIEDALKEIAERHGVTIKPGNTTYSDNSATLKLEITTKSKSGEERTKEMIALEDVYPNFVNKKIKFSGKNFTIVGFSSRSKKYPFLGKQDNGKVFKLPYEIVNLV